VLGNKRVCGLTLFALVFAAACGNTGNNPNHAQGGAGTGTGAATNGGNSASGSAGANATAGSDGVAGSETAGSTSGGNAGSGGTDTTVGGADGGEGPVTPPDQVELVREKVPTKLDLLMMIDNSISMADKQQLLADAMQHLVSRLVQPRCLDAQGMPTGQQATPGGVCPLGSQPEFLPFGDIHAAVITSSLGPHGASGPKDVCVSAEDDDHAQLLGVIRPALPNWNNKGFLVWDPQQMLTPVGIADPAEFATDLAQTVEAAGEHGCGYEAQLEAWYRFLIDPEPPAAVVVPQGTSTAVIQGVSAQVLAQRAAFLRSDSVLGIVMLSDENDCSIIDQGYGWLIPRASAMYRSTSQCAANPNDNCCQSCGEVAAHAGCPVIASDTECAKGSMLGQNTGEDDLNLRCYHQKQRFGFDLLYPTQRYIDGLTSVQVVRRSDNAMVPNPIYETRNGAPPRSPEQVLMLGIVGVPWQDVADAASLTKPGLKLMSEDGPLPAARWDVILGNLDASPPVLPTDPFMVESPDDRTALGLPLANPVVPAETLVVSSSTDPQANHINGHETINSGNSDLQYACTFRLPKPLTCDQAADDAGSGCDCFAPDGHFNRSLCQPPAGGVPGTTQYFGKAYPGLRELSVLKGIGGHGIVASSCPKNADAQSDSYGYRPAMDALAGRVAKQIGRSCVNRDAKADANGRTACSIVTASSAATCACPAGQGLSLPAADAVAPVLAELAAVGYCGPGMSCDAICLCGLAQLDGADLTACQTAAIAPDAPGFCYLDAVKGEVQAGSAALAADCVGAAPRRIRFTGGAPAAGSLALLYCPE
jgi:hypothetical protein